jgi:hypothetical protein
LNHAQRSCTIKYTFKILLYPQRNHTKVKGKPTMKILDFYWKAEIEHNARSLLRMKLKKKLAYTLVLLFENKRLTIHKKYINKVYV